MRNLTCQVAGIPFHNPLVLASGSLGFGAQYANRYDINRLGGILCKGMMLNPCADSEHILLMETAEGMSKQIGFGHVSIDGFLQQDMPYWETIDPVKIVNIGGSCVEEFVLGTLKIVKDAEERRRMNRRAVDMIELNLLAFGIKLATAREVIREVRQVTSLPLAVKLSPEAECIVQLAMMCEQEGAECITLVNHFSALKIDIYKRRHVSQHPESPYAALSGSAIKPIALRMVHQVVQQVSIPVIGMGGITTAADVIEFIMAGAEIVQIGAYHGANIRAGEEILMGIQSFMELENIYNLEEIRGVVRL
ncbi:dihydroorotate dehydrogenase [Paenibacillus sp. 481]|uniref:dihydroorotate dehydrogenase n=1 Tax=Paenibacillus sp. 481 TaxID=2835869 RepID=UPI001E5816A9|nr:dihydroorotate dehydrogenase [Paenibacillus sp. 481]UHA76305.1 dihydroorotate dehydrogenase [Paenibacillus sp. 481]